jgi:hypothetical protein
MLLNLRLRSRQTVLELFVSVRLEGHRCMVRVLMLRCYQGSNSISSSGHAAIARYASWKESECANLRNITCKSENTLHQAGSR